MATLLQADHEPERMSKGQRTREEILGAAVRLASVHGLEALSIGMLATELGMSKAGLVAHFGNKQALQVAAVDAGRELVRARIVLPSMAEQEGLPQFRAFVQLYFDFIRRRVLPGGCFFTAISVEFDDQDGPVRERLCVHLRERDDLIASIFARAQSLGQIRPDADAAQLAFEMVLLMQGAVVRHQLMRDTDILVRAIRAIDNRIALVST